MKRRIPYKQGPLDPPPKRPIAYPRVPPNPTYPTKDWVRVRGQRRRLDPDAIIEALRAVQAAGRRAVLDIIETAWAVELGIRSEPPGRSQEIARALRGAAPEWEIEEAAFPAASCSDAPLRLSCSMARPGVPDWAPLRDIRNFGERDPLSGILEAPGQMREDEGLWIELQLSQVRPGRLAKMARELTKAAPGEGVSGLVNALLDTGPREARFEASLQRRFEERMAELAIEVAGTVTLWGRDRVRLESMARSLIPVFATVFDGGFGGITLDSWRWWGGLQTFDIGSATRKSSLCVTAAECGLIWHPPSERVFTPGVTFVRRAPIPLPREVTRAQGPLLGVHHERGIDLPVHMSRRDLDAGGPVAIIGPTGAGKTTLLCRVLGDLAAAPDRPTLFLIDPPGTAIPILISHAIPRSRDEDIVLLEMGDAEWPRQLSPLGIVPGVPRDVQREVVYSVLISAVRDQWLSPRIADGFYALVSALLELPGATLLDSSRIFDDARLRGQLLNSLDDPAALQYWASYEASSEATQRDLSRKVLSRMWSLLRSRHIRACLCGSGGIDFGALMDRGKIILVSLAGLAIQSGADLLGKLALAGVQVPAMARLERPPESLKRTYLVVDEAQRVGKDSPSFNFLIREGRKLKITILLCSQYGGALGESLAENVVANAGGIVVFRLSSADARQFAPSLSPFTPEQLQSLDRHQAVARIQIDGLATPAFDFTTVPIGNSYDEARLAEVRANSRRLYARTRQEVEEEIARRYEVERYANGGFDIVDEE